MKVVVITGASSGIGYSLANFLNDKGYKVYGISRSRVEIKGVTHMTGDVTNELQINNIIDNIIKEAGQIDYLINNAGMGISGSIEQTLIEDARQIFEVNFMGTFITTKAVIKYMRKQKNGRIINVGSVASEFSIPFQTFYSSSKAAVKTFSEGLANEVSPFGIEVSTILPGDIKTNFSKNRKKNVNETKEYKNRVNKSIALMEKDEQSGMSTSYANKIIYKVMTKRKMPLIKTIGIKYKLFLFFKRFLSTKLINKAVGMIYGFKKE